MAEIRLAAHGSLTSATEDALVGLTDLLVVEGPSGPVLLATTRGDGWLTAFNVAGSTHSVLDEWAISAARLQLESTNLAVIRRDGHDHVALTGLLDSDLNALPLTSGGTGSFLGSATDHTASGVDLGTLSELSVLNASSGREWGFGALRSGGLLFLDFAENGVTTATTLNTGRALHDEWASAVTTFQSGSRMFAFAAFGQEDAISSFRINTNGTVTALDDLTVEGTGPSLARPQAMQAVQIGAKVFVILAASSADTLSVFEVAPNGTMTLRDVIMDTRDTRFANASHLEVITIDDRVFVAAAGTDRGISLFSLTPGGQLVHHHSVPASIDVPLNGITDLALSYEGNTLRIWVATQGAPYLVEYRATGIDLGNTELGTTSDWTTTGTSDDDLLEGQQGDDQISGGNGDDIILDGAGRDTLTGGAGDDLFQLTPDATWDRIADFDPNNDKLDLTRLPGLWDPDDIVVLSRSWGAELRYRGEVLELRAADGGSLSRSEVMETIVETGRISLNAAGGAITGTTLADDFNGGDAGESFDALGGNDSLRGNGGDDTLIGGAGNDTLSGGIGEDSLDGGEGDDTLTGNAGFDTILGGDGDDEINGGDQADSLRGGDGDDRLVGDGGFDNLFGDAGNDTLLGGDTADRLHGGDGNDLLFGGVNFGITVDGLFGEAGDDTLFGEGGFDYLDGGTGNDSLNGGQQADNLYGRAGNDTLDGEDGLDRLFGGDGDDVAFGRAGNDGLFGEGGNDLLDGGDGDDRFFGGVGNDTLLGGAGNDEMFGGAGFDTITGGTGNDTMAGDFNADTFVFANGHGDDRITDFEASNQFEKIDLGAVTAITSFSDLSSNHLSQSGGDALIDTGGGNSLRLVGVSTSDLDATDFLF